MTRGIIKKLARLPAPLAKPRVRTISSDDGYGVIEGEGREVFFLAAAVTGAPFTELKVGQAVDFEIEQGPLGRAARVAPVNDATSPALLTT